MDVPEYMHRDLAWIIQSEVELVKTKRAYWEMRIEHEKREHELRCQKARCNEQGVQIQ